MTTSSSAAYNDRETQLDLAANEATLAPWLRMPTLTEAEQADVDLAFPVIDPGILPFGSRVLVQIRRPIKRTRGGLILPDETVDTDKWNTQVGKVIAIGPLAFRNRTTMDPWREGAWAHPGEFVRCMKYGGDRWEIPINDKETVQFVLFDDLNLLGLVTVNPLSIKAYL